MKRQEYVLPPFASNLDDGTPPSRLRAEMSNATVVLIDDDELFLKSVERVVRSAGLHAAPYSNVEDFLSNAMPKGATCIVVEASLQIVSGLDLQKHLMLTGNTTPLIFLTKVDSAKTAVEAMKSGAVDYLVKPLCEPRLLDSIHDALEQDALRKRNSHEAAPLARGLRSLTPRERQVVDLVATGKLNKQIADQLGISEMTVKVHRTRIMKKMGAKSVVDLVRRFDKSVHGAVER